MKRHLLVLFLLLGLASPALAEEKKELKLAYVEWDCATASTYLAKAVLEEKLGYKVETLSTSLPMIWPSLVSKDVDAQLSLWLPGTHKEGYAQVKDKTEIMNKLTDGARIGLVVPDYVPIKSIEELKANADKFNNNIIGIEPGAGIMGLTEQVIKDYGLPMTILDGSSATMTAMLGDAIRRNEWVVVTGWSPHWKFGRWNLRYLEDPKQVYGSQESIYILARQGLKEDHPAVWNLFKRMHYTDVAQFQTYMSWNQEPGMTPEKGAKRFMETYPDLVAEWLE